MPKNVVICCDGTANEFAGDQTNVLKLFSTLVQVPEQQTAFYHPGLGTMEAPAALTPFARRITRCLGKAIGYGIESDIRDAYVSLMNNYTAGDHLFLFGFSRGAYTVRSLASVLHMYGLMPTGNEPLVPYAIRMLMAINKAGRKTTEPDVTRVFKLAQDFKATFSSIACTPYFAGVWDTVSSVGWVENQTRLPYTSNNPDIRIGRHAIAIDERRAFFRTNLWHPSPDGGPKDLKQVWFAGVHCDVGGGYPEKESGLSKISLEWMIKEAHSAGLLIDNTRVDRVLGRSGADYVRADSTAQLHESLTPTW